MKTASAHEIIKEIRQKRGISQKELADRVGLTQQAIALLENNKRKLEFDIFLKILDSMNVSQQELSNIVNKIYVQESESLCEMTTFIDEIDDYLQEIGEFLYYNPKHRVLFDASMEVKSMDVDLAKEMLDRINGKIPDQPHTIAAHAIPGATEEDQRHDDAIMNDEDF